MTTVRVSKRKYPRQIRPVWETEVLTRDHHGLWLVCRQDSNGVGQPRHAGVQLLPSTGWYVAWWWDDPDHLCTVDIATPVYEDATVICYDDLELDIVCHSDGRVEVVDEDEFDEARATVPYPDDVVAAARHWCAEIVERMQRGDEPFKALGWLRLAAALNLKAGRLSATD